MSCGTKNQWNMKRWLLIIIIVGGQCAASEKDEVLAVFWNLENFFDYIDGGGGESDTEFSSFGSRRWTRRRFYEKCDAIAKSFLWIGEHYGKIPDVIGVAEIENRYVLKRMLESTLLRKYGYEIIHRDSRDRRGIDVALLYRKDAWKLSDVSFEEIVHEGDTLDTRDILCVSLENLSGEIYTFMVNHHPSKYGGAEASSPKRKAAMEALCKACSGKENIIAMGDFNDTPDSGPFAVTEGILCCKADSLFACGEGTIRHEGRWELIDMFLVSPELCDRSEMYICRPPFLMIYDKKHPGEKPLRTYSGLRHTGGVSDHCPIILRVL